MCELFTPFFKTLISIYHFNSYKKDCEIFYSLNKALNKWKVSLDKWKVSLSVGRNIILLEAFFTTRLKF